MTAREFAAAINRPYPTVALWLRRNKVPGAYQQSVGDFSIWQIPTEAVKEFAPPKLGRPKKEGEASAAATSATSRPTKKAPAKNPTGARTAVKKAIARKATKTAKK